MAGVKYFAVDARTVLSLGRESIKDHTTAVLELVKNAYDAGATVCDIEIASGASAKSNFIRIADNGHGMTEADIDNRWLRIGYSDKRRHKMRAERRCVGEKGVGRLSADRLGAKLQLRSQSRNQPATGLTVSWDAFDKPGTDIGAIPINMLDSPEFHVPRPYERGGDTESFTIVAAAPNSRSVTGTELRIALLRQNWTPHDIDELKRELSILTPPFGHVVDFQIRLTSNVHPASNGVIASPFFEIAHIDAHFSYKSSTSITYTINNKSEATASESEARSSERITIGWDQFVHRTNDTTTSNGAPKPPLMGPVEVRLLFYPRLAKTLRGTDMTLGQLRDFLDAQAGLKVYRDNIRVMPYGDLNKAEGGDWLGLGDRKARNPAGPGRPDFRVAPNQLVGAVFLSRDKNPGLVDTSGREGLVHGDAFADLSAFVFGCITRLEMHYHTIFVKEAKLESIPVSPREAVETFGSDLKELKKQLDAVQAEFPKRAERHIERVQDQIGAAVDQITTLEKSIADLANQATIYRALASVGISAATFSHETDAALDQFLSSVFAAKNMLESPSVDPAEVVDELEKSIAASQRISAWGRFALRRIRPDKRRRRQIDFGQIIGDLVEEFRPAFKASEIDIDATLPTLHGRAFVMDIESIVINILTNAYYFSKQSSRKRAIRITLRSLKRESRQGLQISVADSGPGIAIKDVDHIWNPLFSTKVNAKGRPTGTGLGLSIVDDIVKDLNGHHSVLRDETLKGALFQIWLPII